MPKYRVTVIEYFAHSVDVEADDEDEAREMARVCVVRGDPGVEDMGCQGRDVTFIYEVE